MQMWTRLRTKKNREPMKDQRRMWRINLRTSDVNRYQSKNSDDVNTDAEKDTSQADDGSTHNVKD
jgi:hypothetical protein